MNRFFRWFGNTPWWLISAGIHVVLLLGATLVCIERLMAIEGPECFVAPRAPRNVQCFDYPRDVVERRAFARPESTADAAPEELPLFAESAKSVRFNDGGDGLPEALLERPPAPVWNAAITPADRRDPGRAATNLLRTGAGEGYGQRSEDESAIRIQMRIISGCISVTESSVTWALRWLARHQNADGGWSADGFGGRCPAEVCSGAGDPGHHTGVTGLAVLAFLGAGFAHTSRDEFYDPTSEKTIHYGGAVKNGLKWLASQQDAEGCVGPRGPRYLYNHAIATIALCEGFGMSGAEPLRLPAQRAVDFLIASQNPGKGWRYSARSGDNDTSVTGWAVMALKSAELSGLTFPKSAYDGALAWLREATEKEGHGRTGYTQAGSGKVYIPGRNEQFADHPTMSAVSLLSHLFIRKSKTDPSMGAVADLLADLPAWEPGRVDLYYWYYASLALYQADGPSGSSWAKWNEPMKKALVLSQKTGKDGCANGSWDPAEDRWGAEGGRVYATALNCLTLEVYYRYANVFGGSGTH